MTEWVVLSLDAKQAKQHGMPEKVPMPKDQFEAVGIKGLTHETAHKWITEFMTSAGPTLRQKEPATAKRYEAYLSKMKFWQDAQKAFTKRDFTKAASLLQLVANVDKEDYAAKQNLATVHAALGNHDAAVKVFTEISEVWSGSAEYHVAFANTLIAAGNKDGAIEQFVQALEAESDCRMAMEGLVTLGLLVKIYEDPLDPKSLTFVRRDSLLAYLTGEWEKASPSLDFLLRVGTYHESESRYEVALAAAERALATAPGNEAALLLKASSLRRLNKTAQAVELLQSHVATSPNAASALAQLAQLAFEAKDAAKGHEWAGKALAVDAGHLTALQLEFFESIDPPSLEQAAASVEAIEAYAATHAQAAGAQRMLGRILLQINSEERAVAALEAATKLAPSDDDVLAEYLNALLRYGRFQAVLGVVGSLADLSKRDWRLRWSEADAYLGLGKKMEARAAFTGINADDSLHVSVRARAKRAVENMGS
jgi:tetratricopeptide (TPR) repeat protein